MVSKLNNDSKQCQQDRAPDGNSKLTFLYTLIPVKDRASNPALISRPPLRSSRSYDQQITTRSRSYDQQITTTTTYGRTNSTSSNSPNPTTTYNPYENDDEEHTVAGNPPLVLPITVAGKPPLSPPRCCVCKKALLAKDRTTHGGKELHNACFNNLEQDQSSQSVSGSQKLNEDEPICEEGNSSQLVKLNETDEEVNVVAPISQKDQLSQLVKLNESDEKVNAVALVCSVCKEKLNQFDDINSKFGQVTHKACFFDKEVQSSQSVGIPFTASTASELPPSPSSSTLTSTYGSQNANSPIDHERSSVILNEADEESIFEENILNEDELNDKDPICEDKTTLIEEEKENKELPPVAECWGSFLSEKVKGVKEIQEKFSQLAQKLKLSEDKLNQIHKDGYHPTTSDNLYQGTRLTYQLMRHNDKESSKHNLGSKLCELLAAKIDAKLDVNKKETPSVYEECRKNNGCRHVLIIGAGPTGLRMAIECAFMGFKVSVVEKRNEFTRNNILHLWVHIVKDLTNIGGKILYSKLGPQSINHVSIRRLQCTMFKICLLLGVRVYFETSFVKILDPHNNCGELGAKFLPVGGQLDKQIFNVIIGADGTGSNLAGFNVKNANPAGKLSIGITANFDRVDSKEDRECEEKPGQGVEKLPELFELIKTRTNLQLENVVYYKGDTHYVAMTATKESLLKLGVCRMGLTSSQELLESSNIDLDKLCDVVKKCFTIVTEKKQDGEVKTAGLDYELTTNQNNKPDIMIFDYNQWFKSENAITIVKHNRNITILGLVGDSLHTPVWPEGKGIARGFSSVMDTAWSLKQLYGDLETPIEVLKQREGLLRISGSLTPDHIKSAYESHTIDPRTRYQPCCFTETLKPTAFNFLLSPSVKTAKTLFGSNEERMGELMDWVQSIVKPYESVSVDNWTTSWHSGIAFAAIIDKIQPKLLFYKQVEEHWDDSDDSKVIESFNLYVFPVMREHLKLDVAISGENYLTLTHQDSPHEDAVAATVKLVRKLYNAYIYNEKEQQQNEAESFHDDEYNIPAIKSELQQGNNDSNGAQALSEVKEPEMTQTKQSQSHLVIKKSRFTQNVQAPQEDTQYQQQQVVSNKTSPQEESEVNATEEAAAMPLDKKTSTTTIPGRLSDSRFSIFTSGAAVKPLAPKTAAATPGKLNRNLSVKKSLEKIHHLKKDPPKSKPALLCNVCRKVELQTSDVTTCGACLNYEAATNVAPKTLNNRVQAGIIPVPPAMPKILVQAGIIPVPPAMPKIFSNVRILPTANGNNKYSPPHPIKRPNKETPKKNDALFDELRQFQLFQRKMKNQSTSIPVVPKKDEKPKEAVESASIDEPTQKTSDEKPKEAVESTSIVEPTQKASISVVPKIDEKPKNPVVATIAATETFSTATFTPPQTPVSPNRIDKFKMCASERMPPETDFFSPAPKEVVSRKKLSRNLVAVFEKPCIKGSLNLDHASKAPQISDQKEASEITKKEPEAPQQEKSDQKVAPVKGDKTVKQLANAFSPTPQPQSTPIVPVPTSNPQPQSTTPIVPVPTSTPQPQSTSTTSIVPKPIVRKMRYVSQGFGRYVLQVPDEKNKFVVIHKESN